MTTTTSNLRVRYAEIAGDHVYYANYFAWIEANMGGFYREHGIPWLGFEHTGITTMVAESHARFIRPARYDDIVTVSTTFVAAAPKRACFVHEISRQGEPLAQLRTTHVLRMAGHEGLQVIPEAVAGLAGSRVERVAVLDKPEDFPDPDGCGTRFHNLAEFPVRYKETDAVATVYFSNHYVYYEVGRTELLRAAGATFTDLKAGGVRLPVARAYCRYLAPVRYGDSVAVKTWIAWARKVQLTFRYELTRKSDGALCAAGFTTHGCLDASDRAVRVPELLENLAKTSL